MSVEKRLQLLQDGFCVVPSVLSPATLDHLRTITNALLENDSSYKSHRSQGSMLPTNSSPAFVDLIALPATLNILASLGYKHPTFSDGYVISKPGHSPRLFWHYDWFAWQDAASWEPEPPQLFAMYYLSDTRRENGCLRVIPGSHLNDNSLHPFLAEPHSKELAAARDLSRPEFSDRPDEIDVPVNAGDLVLGDARLLHAAHENLTDERRTLITLGYQPDFAALPTRIQAQMAAKTQPIPSDWPSAVRSQLLPLLPQAESGVDPYPRTVRRHNREASCVTPT